jgi:hypothetical protein
MRRAELACLGAICVLAVVACGTTRRVAVIVNSQDRVPVPHATVVVRGTRIAATTDEQGHAALSGLRPGIHELTISAPGYQTVDTRRRVRRRGALSVELLYALPLGTFVWNIGPAGEYWDIATVTKAGVTATEYDWTCTKQQATGTQVGHWLAFPGAQPYAVAPNTMAPEWVRRRFRGGRPPTPRSGCRP